MLDAHGAVDHAAAAARFTADAERTGWHDGALWFVREKRDRAAAMVPEWEALRELASAIKTHTLAHLDQYLEHFERAATARGIVVHWARDAAEHNRIVHAILAERGVRRVVKSKSMLTEECGLNPYLGARGIEVVDTDLGERIVQLRGEPPSHIVMPAIHLKKEEIGETFHALMGTPAGLADPDLLTAAARAQLRDRFLGADAAMTGVNFGIAETGGIVVCTNEGNADLGTSLAPVHIASMGIEKLIPRAAGPGRLPAAPGAERDGAGEYRVRLAHARPTRRDRRCTWCWWTTGAANSWGAPTSGDRSSAFAARPASTPARCTVGLGDTAMGRRSPARSARCSPRGATCSATLPSPSPARSAARARRSVRSRSTSTRSCTNGDSRWRLPVLCRPGKAWFMRRLGTVLADRELVQLAGAVARGVLRLLPARVARRLAGGWGRTRTLPPPPKESFRDWYRANRPSP